MKFKDYLTSDTATFLNPEEFGEEHEIDGKKMLVMIDDNEEIEREKRMSSHSDGIFLKQILFYVSKEEFGDKLPVIDRVMRFDKKSYKVTDAIDEGGIYSISLRAVRSS